MGDQPLLAFLVIRILSLRGKLAIDEEKRQRFHSLGLKEPLNLWILDEGQWLLGKVKTLHSYPMFF